MQSTVSYIYLVIQYSLTYCLMKASCSPWDKLQVGTGCWLEGEMPPTMREKGHLCVYRQRCTELEALIQAQRGGQADHETSRSNAEHSDQDARSQGAEVEQLKHQLEVSACCSHLQLMLIYFTF